MNHIIIIDIYYCGPDMHAKVKNKVKNNQCMNLNVERKGYVIPTLRFAM